MKSAESKGIIGLKIMVHEAVDQELQKLGLTEGFAAIETALLQLEGTARGEPAIMLVLDVNGRKVLAKTSLHLMESAVRMMRAVAEHAKEEKAHG
jgi:hypothetical protein